MNKYTNPLPWDRKRRTPGRCRGKFVTLGGCFFIPLLHSKEKANQPGMKYKSPGGGRKWKENLRCLYRKISRGWKEMEGLGLKRVLGLPVMGKQDSGVVRFAVGPFEDHHWHPGEEIVETSHDSRGVGCGCFLEKASVVWCVYWVHGVKVKSPLGWRRDCR